MTVVIQCPLTKKDIIESVIAPDGITYERSALLKYIRKYHKSPVTGEKMDLSTLVYEKDYIDSELNKSEEILNSVRNELEECIKLKRQFANFEQIPENIQISIVKNEENWKIHITSTINEELPEKFLKNMEYSLSYAYFQIKDDKSVYTSIHRGNGNIDIRGSKKIHDITEAIITRYSSFTKENQVRNWLNEIESEQILSKPLRIILGKDDTNESLIHNDTSELLTDLNEEQKKVFKKECFKTLQVVEGPPGTGKTSIITTMLDYIHQNISLKKERHYTLVISEKNRGVDAVAERLHQNKYNQVISFGSDNIGDFTKSYLIENKLQYHSVVTNTYQQIYELEQSCEQKTRKIKRVLYNCLPKYILKNLSWRNIGLIQHQINNANIRNNKKRDIALSILNEMNQLITTLNIVYSSLSEKNKEAEEKYKEDCTIILSTFGSLHQVSNFLKDIDNVSFSIIIDESSTLLSWQGFYLEHFVNELGGSLTNMIIVGDPKQLPPYWPDHENPNQEKKSFLDLAKEKCDSVQLVQQYRMPNQIMKILNKEYYVDKPLILSHNRIIKDEINWIHSNGVEEEENHVEAHMIINALSQIPINYSIMAISPYRTQCDVLTKLCQMYLPHVKVMTLDSVQGHESDIVAVSLVKSNPTMFLTKKRTCVLVSRAREKLLVFGNRQGCLSCKNGALRRLARFSGIKAKKKA
tara:strand:- start:32637 stop:34724 length:2088 start_codon:yes stop_codon:yes gene_type:complete